MEYIDQDGIAEFGDCSDRLTFTANVIAAGTSPVPLALAPTPPSKSRDWWWLVIVVVLILAVTSE